MAATKLTYAREGFVIKESQPALYDKAMDLFLTREDMVPLQGGKFFKVDQARTLSFKLTTTGKVLDLPEISEDTDPLKLDSPASGYDKTITLNTLRKAVAIDETTVKVDTSGGAAMEKLQGLPDSGRRWLEYSYADVVNSGFATAGADGSFLFANDHYHEDPTAGQWDNLETSAALTTATFNTMRENMKARTNERGQVMGIDLLELVVPIRLEEKARQIAGSDKVPESSLEGINPWKGVNFTVWQYLTSNTAWFGWGSLPESMWGLHYVWLTQPTVTSLGFPSPMYPYIKAGFSLKIQAACAASQVKNMHGNVGT